MSFVLADYAELEGKRSDLGIGNTVRYETPLSGGGKYIGKIIAIEGDVYKLQVKKIIKKSTNPLSPIIGSYHYVAFYWEK